MAGSLEDYKAKRDFALTREPAPKDVAKGKAPTALSFVVQKHAARRLHYDFRLELDGVLKSWAVARGPSLDPHEKRLAVHVEDHPLDYGGFEGTIPAGQYGGGTVIVWDRGTWQPEEDPHRGYAKGHLRFTLSGEKLGGGWHLVRMHGKPGERTENWLLIKQDDASADAQRDILADAPNSVKSGHTIEEVARDDSAPQWRSDRAATPAAVSKPTSPRQRAAAPLPEPAVTSGKQATASPRKSKAAGKPETPQIAPLALPRKAKRAAMPDFIPPALATLGTTPPRGGWLHEVKFDGYRMQAVCRGGQATLRTRTGLDWTARFAPVAAAIEALGRPDIVLDGEIVVEGPDGVTDFGALQDALQSGRTNAFVFYVFDCLHADGRDLMPLPLVDRIALLPVILADAPAGGIVRLSEHFDADGATMLQHVCQLGGEGIISKRRDAPYRSGRTADWVKAKCAARQEFVIVGYVPSTASKGAIGSLVVGYNVDGKLVHGGRVGTGYTSDRAVMLRKLLDPDRVKSPPVAGPLPADVRRGVVWVAPKRIAEVEFRGWGNGGLVRQASFKGLREDKDPAEIVREDMRGAPVGSYDAPRSAPAKPAVARPDVVLTHPDRVLWPEAGITKDGLADYYTLAWPWIAPHLVARPLSLVRCPTGIGKSCFFQKHRWEGMNAAIHSRADPKDGEAMVHIEDLAGLIGLVQASVLEIHPWGAAIDDIERPDRVIFDLDPGEGVGWDRLCDAARDVRAHLRSFGLESFVKTSGGKGLHVVAPLVPKIGWDDAKAFCHAVSEDLARAKPDAYLAVMTKAKRVGRIYVDYLRNGRGATAVAPFSTRARIEAGVSTPLSWDEIDSVGSGARFTVLNIAARLSHLSVDPWHGFADLRQSLPDPSGPPAKPRKRR